MRRLLLRTRARIRDATKPLGEAAVGAVTIGLLRTTRYFDPIKTANLFGRITRFIGPMTREQRIARANLAAAFRKNQPRRSRPFSKASGIISAASAPNSHISIISGSMIAPVPKTAGSKSRSVPTNCLRSCGSTASRR